MSKTASNAENTRRSVKPLSGLMPYLKRYKGIVGAALFFLALAAIATLALPLAGQFEIDMQACALVKSNRRQPFMRQLADATARLFSPLL